jgi:hypothetical protein
MMKVLGWILKATLFTAVVLIASHLITWNGKSVSDQVRSGISSAERAVPAGAALKTVKKKSRALVEDAREAAAKVGVGQPAAKTSRLKAEDLDSHSESPTQNDREELQALIHSSDAA